MRSTKFQQPEQEQVRVETLPERMARLVLEEGELAQKEDALKKQLSEAGQRDRVAILKAGGNLHPLVDAEDLLAKLAQVEADRSDYGAAIRSLRLEADVARKLEARQAREKQRPEFTKAIRKYLEAVRDLIPVMNAVRSFDEFKISPMILPGTVGLQDLPDQEMNFARELQHRGINPGDIGVEIPAPHVPPVEVLSAERKRNMRERYPESVISSDMPKPGHFV